MVKVIIGIGFLFCVEFNCCYGQEVIHTAGGSVSEMTYSIGQVAYSSGESETGTIDQGVIDPFDISILSGEDHKEINLIMKAYPNPVQSTLFLEITDSETLNTKMFNVDGVIVNEGSVDGRMTELDMNPYLNGVYVLKVYAVEKEIKTFKIIKQ